MAAMTQMKREAIKNPFKKDPNDWKEWDDASKLLSSIAFSRSLENLAAYGDKPFRAALGIDAKTFLADPDKHLKKLKSKAKQKKFFSKGKSILSKREILDMVKGKVHDHKQTVQRRSRKTQMAQLGKDWEAHLKKHPQADKTTFRRRWDKDHKSKKATPHVDSQHVASIHRVASLYLDRK